MIFLPIASPLTVLLWLLLCFWTWGIFLWWVPPSPVNGCPATICDFGVLTGEGELTSFYSAILVSDAPGNQNVHVTCLIMILTLLQWSGTKSTSPRVCLYFTYCKRTHKHLRKSLILKLELKTNRGRHTETIYLRLGLEPNQMPAWDLNPCGWDSTQPKPMVPGFRTQ